MKRLITLGLILATLSSCEPQLTADRIVKKSIAYHNLDKLYTTPIDFQFREYLFHINRSVDPYIYSRQLSYIDSITYQPVVQVDSLLGSTNLKRYQNNLRVDLTTEEATKYANSINSVAYFQQLPLPLTDPAARLELLTNTTIEGSDHYTLKVTFATENGGADPDDTYRYYFNSKTFALSYLSYDFHINGGGVRFRKAYPNPHPPFIFLNYNNYKAPKDTPLDSLPQLFERGVLELVSRIEGKVL
jgi:hypothetical protein